MDIRHLRYFITIVEEGPSITKAAKRLNIAQPPLSAQLKVLEDELGIILFVRNGKKLELTNAGKVLYNRAIHIVSIFDATVTEIKAMKGRISGELSLGFSVFFSSIFAEKIKIFQKEFPLVKIKICEAHSNRLYDLLESRQIDLAFVNTPKDLSRLSMIKLDDQILYYLAPLEWELKQQNQIKLDDIKSLPLVILNQEKNAVTNEILDKYSQNGFKPNIICECNDLLTLIKLVESGIGGTILPESLVNDLPSDKFRIMAFNESLYRSESAIVWMRDRLLSNLAKRFLEAF